MNAIMAVEWFTIENRQGVPLAERHGHPMIFSKREYADKIMALAEVPGARIVRHAGDHDALVFIDKIARSGATRLVTDAGQPFATWISLNQGDWNFDAIRQARAAAVGLEVV